MLLGPPGAGKGTQAKALAGKLSISHIASGDLFRYHQHQGTPLGLKALEYMTAGLLVPDEITIAMVLEQVLPPLGSKAYLLDGFPRNMNQAEALDEALAGRWQRIGKVIHMRLPLEEAIKRLSRRLVCRQCQAPFEGDTAPPKSPNVCGHCGGELYQREDDAPEAVRVRLQVYMDETQPLVDYYRRAGTLAEVDAEGTVKEVRHRLLESLKN